LVYKPSFIIIIISLSPAAGDDKKNEETPTIGIDEKDSEDEGIKQLDCQLCVDFADRDIDVRSPFPGYFPAKLFPVQCATCGKGLVLRVQGTSEISLNYIFNITVTT
jgi:hypothetical protein